MSKNKIIEKLTAMILSIIMVVGITPVSALAETSVLPIGANGEITAFEKLAEEIAVQNVLLETSDSDLELPGVLIATVQLASLEDEAMDLGQANSEADSTDMVSGAISIEESSDTDGKTDISPAHEQEAEGASIDEPSEIRTLLPVTWASSPEYDSQVTGIYIFTPELPKDFTLADGVELPTITVTVLEDESTASTAREMSTLFSAGSGEAPEWELEGDGTEGDPYLIKIAADLVKLAELVNTGNDFYGKYFTLEEDISLSDYGEVYDHSKGWQPIGICYYNGPGEYGFYSFRGIFDGAGNKITDLYINRSDELYVGLFGHINGGTVKNLTVEGGNVTGSSCTGGIVGFLDNGRVENCNFSGSVTGEEGIGGIVGILLDSQLKDCVNTASVSGTLATGGIVGSAGNSSEDGSIENCVNTGKVTGSIAFTGGIAGSLKRMLADYCVNTGTVQGGTGMNTGGVAGEVIEGTIQSCVNTGTVKGGTGVNTGGVAGDVSEGIIQNCINSGGVSGSANNIGGMAGLVQAGTIQNCVNYADISGNANSVGGVAGFVKDGSVVTNCLTTGNISGNVTEIEPGGVSGVVGRLNNNGGSFSNRNTISGCVALGQSVTKGGEMGNVARIAATEPHDIAYENFAWSGMKLWYDDELISEEEYSLGDGENADVAVLQTLWTNGALAESWSAVGVWTLAEGKLPVLNELPHQSDKFPSHIPMATVDPTSKAFTTATVGYKQQAAQQFTIANTTTAAILGLSAALADGTKFEISSALSKTQIDSEGTATVDVRPKAGLPVGAYTDVLSITNGDGISLTVSLSFTVNSSSDGGSDNSSSDGGSDNSGSDGGSDNSGSDGGSDNSGDSDGGSYTPPVTATPEKKPDLPIMATTPVTAIAMANGMASAAISDKTIADAIAKAQGKTANGISIGLDVTMPQDATSLSAMLSQKALQSLVSAGVTRFEINSSPVKVAFDLKALQQIHKQSSGDVTITIKAAQNLSAGAKKLIGTRPVYDITISYVKDGKTTVVSALNGGIATISIPYNTGKNEAAGYLYGVYVDAKGDPTRIAGSAYDSNSGCVIFTTTHFSLYGIGYTAPSAMFTDIANHWGKESIDYVVGRGLFFGTWETIFAPNTPMTRGMLVTALGRLAGVDVSGYKTSSFTDVKADSALRPYIEWAYKKGIIQSIDNQQFAPDRDITREEIAVILANYAKATGFTLPVTREALTFADNSSIHSSCKVAVKTMQQAGIMMGGTGNKFNPKSNATRAEVCSMLHRYIKLMINPSTAQGWALNDDGQWFYYQDGKALNGEQTIKGTKYFFETDGALKTDWVQDGDNRRFYSGNRLLVGWWSIGSDTSKHTYYFTKDGLMIFGKWLQIDGKWYYFGADGALAQNTTIEGYEVDENGLSKGK